MFMTEFMNSNICVGKNSMSLKTFFSRLRSIECPLQLEIRTSRFE
jgi:hypothetical protein